MPFLHNFPNPPLSPQTESATPSPCPLCSLFFMAPPHQLDSDAQRQVHIYLHSPHSIQTLGSWIGKEGVLEWDKPVWLIRICRQSLQRGLAVWVLGGVAHPSLSRAWDLPAATGRVRAPKITYWVLWKTSVWAKMHNNYEEGFTTPEN